MSTVENDKRGGRQRHRKVDNTRKNIRKHTKQFPTIDPHYLWQHTIRSTWIRICQLQYVEIVPALVRKTTNRQEQLWLCTCIFNEEFNFSFYTPTPKDQCSVCNEYNNVDDEIIANPQEKYDTHISNKVLVREMKESHK